jgi:hypothetical protein
MHMAASASTLTMVPMVIFGTFGFDLKLIDPETAQRAGYWGLFGTIRSWPTPTDSGDHTNVAFEAVERKCQ